MSAQKDPEAEGKSKHRIFILQYNTSTYELRQSVFASQKGHSQNWEKNKTKLEPSS